MLFLRFLWLSYQDAANEYPRLYPKMWWRVTVVVIASAPLVEVNWSRPEDQMYFVFSVVAIGVWVLYHWPRHVFDRHKRVLARRVACEGGHVSPRKAARLEELAQESRASTYEGKGTFFGYRLLLKPRYRQGHDLYEVHADGSMTRVPSA